MRNRFKVFEDHEQIIIQEALKHFQHALEHESWDLHPVNYSSVRRGNVHRKLVIEKAKDLELELKSKTDSGATIRTAVSSDGKTRLTIEGEWVGYDEE